MRGIVYWYFHLYIGEVAVRFAAGFVATSIRAVTVLAVSLLVLDYMLFIRRCSARSFFGKITIALYWFLQMFFLGGPRIAYRLFRLSRTQQQVKGPMRFRR